MIIRKEPLLFMITYNCPRAFCQVQEKKIFHGSAALSAAGPGSVAAVDT
jgi:hypothetical protein